MSSDDRPLWYTAQPVPPAPPPGPSPAQKREQVQSLIRIVYLLILVNLVSLAVVGFLLQRGFGSYGNVSAAVEPRGDLAEDEKATIELYEKVRPCVVRIDTLARQQEGDADRPRTATGSGFVWDKEGHIVTNYHVVRYEAEAADGEPPARRNTPTYADTILVSLPDDPGNHYKAKVVGSYPDKDLAVLKIDAPARLLLPIRRGSSDNLRVGQKVFAIGNPFGLPESLTKGIISALGRAIQAGDNTRPIRNLIQTDAAINPGNSGGPLLNSSGELIGVNTAIFSPSGASSGIGFAIPVDVVKRVVDQLIENKGKVTRPGLGITIGYQEQGVGQRKLARVVIREVLPESPAEKAGLRPGDVIQSVDGTAIEKINDLFNVLDAHEVGSKVKVKVLRDGKPVETEVQLANVGG